MSYNYPHFLQLMPVGALATIMAAHEGCVTLFLDTEAAEDDDAWNKFIRDIENKFGMATANLIAYRAQPTTQASDLFVNL